MLCKESFEKRDYQCIEIHHISIDERFTLENVLRNIYIVVLSATMQDSMIHNQNSLNKTDCSKQIFPNGFILN